MPPHYSLSDKENNLDTICQKLGINKDKLISAEQVHGDGIAVVSESDAGKRIPKVDALITRDKGAILSVRTADCAPVLIFDAQKNILALVHAGRRGTQLQIVYKTIQKIKSLFGSNPGDLEVKIGPCIGSCCYPVDLRKENLDQLIKAEVLKDQIHIHPECTCCNNHKYFSYRRDGPKTGRMHLVAKL